MAEERALDLRLAGQVDEPLGVPDPLGPGQRAVRADQAEAPGQLPQGEQGQQDRGFLRDPGGQGQPARPRSGQARFGSLARGGLAGAVGWSGGAAWPVAVGWAVAVG